MYKNQRVSVVVPAYNEAMQIGKVIATMPDYVDALVIVDDCSRDETAGIVQRCREQDPRIVLICHEVNQGVGGAIASGYKWSRNHGMDIAVVMAGDGQMDPAEMPQLLDPIVEEHIDYAKNNRLIYDKSYQTIPKVRFLGNSVLSLLTKIASGYWNISDSQTGYTAIGKKALQVIDWDRMYKRYGQPNDLLVKLNVYNFRVKDVPMVPVYNVGEKSGIKVRKVVFTISWLLFKLFWWRMLTKYVIRDFHPLVFFYLLGVLMSCICLLFVIRLMVLWPLEGQAPPMTTLAILFTFSMAMQSFFFAMNLDMEANKHLY